MPVYTYRCESCDVQFDRFQKFSDQPLTRCPECGKKSLRKVYQPVGIVFKGSGFYATDHRSPSGQNRSGTKNEEKSGETEKTDKTDKTEKTEKPASPPKTESE